MKDNKSENPKPIRKIPNKKITPKPPRFNIMWLYAIVILVLLGVGYMSSNPVIKTISYQQFNSQILKALDVEKLLAYKDGDLVVVQVFIKKDSLLRKPIYSEVREQKSITGSLPLSSLCHNFHSSQPTSSNPSDKRHCIRITSPSLTMSSKAVASFNASHR